MHGVVKAFVLVAALMQFGFATGREFVKFDGAATFGQVLKRPANKSCLLEPVKRWVKRAFFEIEVAIGALIDFTGDFAAIGCGWLENG